jgi:S-formylglutathione hydrolase FrmB
MILRGDFLSETLRMTTNIQILIPTYSNDSVPGSMETTVQVPFSMQDKGPYRLVFLLHGLHGGQGTWLDYTMLPYYAREYNAVFVMPEAGRSFYFNLEYGRKYHDFMSEELPYLCRKVFNISAKREDTAVMGCSMGGYGALRLALAKPDLFGFCGAISSACLYFKPMLDALRADPGPYLKTGPEAEAILTDLRAVYGDGLEYRKDYDIVELAKNFPAGMPKPKIYASCGTEDNLRKENVSFNEVMKNTGFDFTYEEWAGGHEWYFFNEALKRTLAFWHKTG